MALTRGRRRELLPPTQSPTCVVSTAILSPPPLLGPIIPFQAQELPPTPSPSSLWREAAFHALESTWAADSDLLAPCPPPTPLLTAPSPAYHASSHSFFQFLHPVWGAPLASRSWLLTPGQQELLLMATDPGLTWPQGDTRTDCILAQSTNTANRC